MGFSNRLTDGLQMLDLEKEIHEGETYVVKYSIKNRSNLWIGVVIPETVVPGPKKGRRPKNAKPLTGDWDIPLEDRLYAVYLPGKYH
jgi:hypothetical protein